MGGDLCDGDASVRDLGVLSVLASILVCLGSRWVTSCSSLGYLPTTAISIGDCSHHFGPTPPRISIPHCLHLLPLLPRAPVDVLAPAPASPRPLPPD